VELPGFGEVMRAESMKITPNAILSRNLAAVVDQALVIALPGKPSGAVECLSFVQGAIPHGVAVAQGTPTSCLNYLGRTDQQAHQLRAIAREMRVCSAARNYVASEMGTLSRAIFNVAYLGLRYAFVGWVNSQGTAGARKRDFPRRSTSFSGCKHPGV